MTDMSTGARGTAARDRGRTAAQWFCYIVGPVLIIAGLLGFIADSSFGTSDELERDTLLGLEVNGWHNLVHLGSGLFLLAMAPKRASARMAAITFGLIYTVVTIIGIAGDGDIFGLLPVNDADHVLHALLAIAGLAAGFTSPADDRAGRGDAVETMGSVETRDRTRAR